MFAGDCDHSNTLDDEDFIQSKDAEATPEEQAAEDAQKDDDGFTNA